MALPRIGSHVLTERRKALRRAAVGDDALDGRQRGTDALDLGHRLLAATENPERSRAILREMARCHTARSARAQAAEVVGLDHGYTLRRLRVEETDEKGRTMRRRRVQLPPGEPESGVDGGHVCERSLLEPQPPPWRDLDLARGHSPEARLDHLDRVRRTEERGDVRLTEVERHAASVRPAPAARLDHDRPGESTRIDCVLRPRLRRLVTLTTDYLDLKLETFLERISSDGLAPGGGSVAAVTVAFAARLVAMVANSSRAGWNEAAGVVAQATAIGDRAMVLAETDATVWEEALTALRDAEHARADDPRRDFRLEQKLDAAAATPLEIASLGADAVALASLAAQRGEGTYRADAAAAAALAAGAARAAAHLVRVNLGIRDSDPRLANALACERAAGDLAERLLETDVR